jgi:acetyltransferase-like isoleucine patch superfamily enzyme
MYILLKSSFEKYKYNYYRKKYNIHPDFEFLGHGTVITGDGDVILGKKSHLNSHCYIACGKGSKVIIGENCHVGHYVTIYAGNIDTENYHPENIRVKPGDVIIEDGCFIGSFTIIPKGVKIGRNSIIGAGSVVTRDIPPNSLAAGVPATIIKKLT